MGDFTTGRYILKPLANQQRFSAVPIQDILAFFAASDMDSGAIKDGVAVNYECHG